MTELFDIPDSAILREPDSQNTYEDAKYTAELFDSAGLQKEILLVTSAAHMPRSVELFQKQGFIVHPAPSNFRVSAIFFSSPIVCFLRKKPWMKLAMPCMNMRDCWRTNG